MIQQFKAALLAWQGLVLGPLQLQPLPPPLAAADKVLWQGVVVGNLTQR
jgi:hypothetical protein